MENAKIKKQLFIGKIIFSLIIASFLFVGVFSFGYFMAFENYKTIAGDQNQLSQSLISLQLERELMKSSCDNFDLQTFSKELNDMGSIMGQLEEQLGKNNPGVIKQKKIFTILQIQHYLLISENNVNCNTQTPIILFFYSNEKELISRAEVIGYIISNHRISHPETMVYSFDYNLDSNLITTMKRINGITQPNSVIIRDKILTNLKNIDELSAAFTVTTSISTNLSTISLN